MILPDKKFYRLQEVAITLGKKSGDKVYAEDVVNYIGQGLLRAHIHHDNGYYLVPDKELTAFSNYVEDKTINNIILSDGSFMPGSPSIFGSNKEIFPNMVYIEDVYIKHEDLIDFEENKCKVSCDRSNNKSSITHPEKPLGTVERKSLHLIIAALVELADFEEKNPYTISKDIRCKIDLSDNTVVTHLRAAFKTRKNV